MELVFIRHFPTPGNLKKQYIGKTDQELDVDYLMANVWRYRGLYPATECLIASPMVRCIQTAKVLFPGQEIQLCEDLRETDFGIFEGKSYDDLKDTPEYQQWLDSNGTGLIPEGESQEAFRTRCVEGFEALMENLIADDVKSVTVAIHGGTIMVLMSQYVKEKCGFYDWQVANGCGFSVTIDDDKWKAGEKSFFNIQKIELLQK